MSEWYSDFNTYLSYLDTFINILYKFPFHLINTFILKRKILQLSCLDKIDYHRSSLFSSFGLFDLAFYLKNTPPTSLNSVSRVALSTALT